MKTKFIFSIAASIGFFSAAHFSYAQQATQWPDFFRADAYTVPHDAPPPPVNDSTGKVEITKELLPLSIFAWKEFIALNWPSSYDTTNFTRGKPDTSKAPIDFAQPDDSGQLVWQTYKHRVEVFPEDTTNYATNFNSAPKYSYQTAGVIPKCGPYNPTNKTWAVNNDAPPLSDIQLFNNLDETSEINLATLFTDPDPNDPGIAPPQTTPLYMGLPKQPRRFIYEAKANQVMFDYIVNNQYFEEDIRSTALQNTYKNVRTEGGGGLAQCPTPDPDNPIVCFPHGKRSDESTGTMGSEGNILVKATWRQLTVDEYKSGRFLTAPIIRYRDPNPHNVVPAGGQDPLPAFCYETIDASPTGNTLPYGLVGLHIIHKTTNYPTYVFATFEQVDNLNSGTPHSSLFYYNRQSGGPVFTGKQTVTSRAHPIPSAANQVTSQVHLQLRQLLSDNGKDPNNSVWLYYKLIGVQGTATDPSDTEATDYFLANLVTETNEVLRSFSGTLDKTTGTIDPRNTNIMTGNTAITGGGCKGCHGNAQVGPHVAPNAPLVQGGTASDFSFITLNAPFDGIPDAINQALLENPPTKPSSNGGGTSGSASQKE